MKQRRKEIAYYDTRANSIFVIDATGFVCKDKNGYGNELGYYGRALLHMMIQHGYVIELGEV